MLAISSSLRDMAPTTAMHAFARNVRRLMDHLGWTQSELQAKSNVAQTTISALLRYGTTSEKVSTLETVEAIAKAFGVEPWKLQIPDVPLDLLLDKQIEQLMTTYTSISPEGRESIWRVAESEARYEAFRAKKKAG